MIESFAHKGLRRLFEKGDSKDISADLVEKLILILTVLNAADTIDAMRLPSFKLHRLSGALKDYWAVTVRANWRVIFRFSDGIASDVNLVDYH